MRQKLSARDKNASHFAYTDLYDETRHTFLLQYPPLLVIGLGIAGVVAFMLVGFLGYRDPLESGFTYAAFHEPWPLYLWFCALIIALQASILRHRTLRRQLAMTLLVTMISMIVVGIIYFYNADIVQFLRQVLNLIHFNLPQLGNNPWTYTIINFGIIIAFWLSTIRRWIRRAMGLPLRAGADIGLDDDDTQDFPDIRQLISGDLIAGAILTLVLSLVFQADIINFFSHLLQTGVNVTTCTVSLPGACHVGGLAGEPPTLNFADRIQTLIYLPLGLLILALGAVVSGLGKEVDEDDATSIFERVVDELVDTVRAALNRRTGIAFNLALGLRSVAWPVLIFLGVLGVAAASRGIQSYLHLQSDNTTCRGTNGAFDAAHCGGQPTLDAVMTMLNHYQQYQSAGLALVTGIGAVVAIVFSLALLLFRWRVAENTLRFLGLVGFVVLLTFWIFSLALSGFNGLFSLTGLSRRVPFPQPGATTIISFASLVLFGAFLLVRRLRSTGQPPRQPATVSTPPSQRQPGT
ncbi:MAG: hypothetical protein ACHQ4H_00535 [Ktedonobacterales bacterium]